MQQAVQQGSILLSTSNTSSKKSLARITSTVPAPTATSTYTATAVSRGAYPRIANLYAFKDASQASTFSRYGLVVAPLSAASSVAALKAQGTGTRALLYLDSYQVNVHASWNNLSYDGFDIYPGWWLTLAGTTLAAPIDSATTSVTVADAAPISAFFPSHPDILIDGESIHVLSISGNTLTVQRGYWSTATTHAAGTRVATHSSSWTGMWDLNVSASCPQNPTTGQTWAQYLAVQAVRDLTVAPWDGVFYDVTNTSQAGSENGQIDANNDNVADGGNGLSGNGWATGEAQLFTLSRSLMPHALLEGNGGAYTETTGLEFENAPHWEGGWPSLQTAYLQMSGATAPAPSSIINPDTSSTSGVQNYRTMRYGLGTALLGNGYYAYDGGVNLHGQTWWYDEYDNGAGSSLASAVTASSATLTVAPGTSGKFLVGDVVRVPLYSTSANGLNLDDEQMRITAISGDTLTVQRGYNGSIASPHEAGTKVATGAQLAAGRGWLGQPVAPASPLALQTPNLVSNGDFESGTVGWTLDNTSPAADTLSLDTTTVASGTASARIEVTQVAPAPPRDVALHSNVGAVVGGQTYTLSYWIKGSAGQTVQAALQQNVSLWTTRAFQQVVLTGQWQHYLLTFTAPTSESDLKAQFNLAGSAGTVWIDGVALQEGDANVWRRDFTNGIVLVNGTASPQSVVVGEGYRRIAGTQDTLTNSGVAMTSVTIPSQDAILLVRS